MTPFSNSAPYGTLQINGLSLHTYAWNIIDVRPLCVPQALRGNDVVIPGTLGQRAYPRRIDAANHSLPLYFTGDCNAGGTAYADRTVGHHTNMGTLLGTLLVPPAGATLAGTITLPGTLGTIQAAVHVNELEFVNHHQSVDDFLLHVTLPDGYFK